MPQHRAHIAPTVAPAVRRLLPLARLAGVASLVALLLVGCLRTEVSIEVNEDGSGVMSFLIAFDRQVVEALQAFGGDEELDPEALMADVDTSDLPPGASVEPYQDGNFAGFRVVVPFAEGDDIAETLARIASDTSGDDPIGTAEGPFDQFALAREGDRWNFAAVVDPASDDVFDEFGEEEGSLDFARALFGDAVFTVRLKLPGEVTEHNADAVEEDGRLRWEIDLFSEEPRAMHATSDVGADVLGWRELDERWLLIGGVAVVGVLIVLAGWLATRQTRASDEE